jgi:phospholipid/cholesterol/gamma-HCH transport system substrate-binding protein
VNALASIRSVLSLRRLTALVVVLLLAAGGLALLRDRGHTTITAYFSSATGLYEGDDVKVLGVVVGTVTDVRAEGSQVRVELSVDSSTPVPDGVKAAIVSPSLVSGRFVQLAPVWTSGPRLGDGASIPVTRTAVPVSFDEVKRELTDIADALGPAAGDKGALNRAISTLDANLADGNDAALRHSISGLRTAAAALADRRSDLFTTVTNLNTFTRDLATHDAAVASFTKRLDSVAGLLDENRSELTGTIRQLDGLTSSLDIFLKHHTGRITRSVGSAGVLAATLAAQADNLATILHVAPHAITGLYNTVEDQAITGRLALANLDSVASLLCGALLSVGATAETCRTAIAPLLHVLGADAVPGSAAAHQLPSGGATQAPRVPAPPASSGSGLSGLSSLLSGLLQPGSAQ